MISLFGSPCISHMQPDQEQHSTYKYFSIRGSNLRHWAHKINRIAIVSNVLSIFAYLCKLYLPIKEISSYKICTTVPFVLFQNKMRNSKPAEAKVMGPLSDGSADKPARSALFYFVRFNTFCLEETLPSYMDIFLSLFSYLR